MAQMTKIDLSIIAARLMPRQDFYTPFYQYIEANFKACVVTVTADNTGFLILV
jgi:hypothetical protein